MFLIKSYLVLFALALVRCQDIPVEDEIPIQDVNNVTNAFNSPITRITGGNAVANRSWFPYQASILSNNVPICSASIIDHRNLLTAAQCVTDRAGEPVQAITLEAIVGDLIIDGNSPESTGIRVPIREVFVHEDFNPASLANDIAVLRIDVLTFNENITSVPISHTSLPAGLNCTVAGWGATSYGGIPSRTLRYTYATTVDIIQCRNLFASLLRLGMICAGGQGRDACLGDEGAALVCNAVQVGLVTWGLGCGDQLTPSVYTSVPHFFTWIQIQQERVSNNATRNAKSLVVLTITVIVYSLIQKLYKP